MSLTAPPELDLRKVTAHIGAEVVGLDISQPLDSLTVAAVRGALNRHKALVFRHADLDDAAQQAFAAQFGPVTSAHPTVPSVDGEPNVLPVDSDRGVANQWHTDVTFVVNPPQLSTLRSVEVPPYGGETLIANTAAAYNSLPDPLRHLADELWAVHSNLYDYVADSRTEEQRKIFTAIEYETLHPVVRVHPVSGERGLFLGGFVRRFDGLSNDESRALLSIFQSYITRPEHVLRWSWSANELLLFDNRITQHYAVDNYDRLPRRLRRVTVAGDIPVGVDGRSSRSIEGDASHYTEVLQPA